MFSNYEVWRDTAVAKGCDLELDGSGKIVAHVDGVEIGIWDNTYGGCGAGWFN